MASYTVDEIAATEDITKTTAHRKIEVCSDLSKMNKRNKNLANYEDENFKPPIDNVWSFAGKTNETSHFGNTEQRITDNLLYMYTEPFEVVYDPFGGTKKGRGT